MKKLPLIGLVPAGGKATRISPLPLSKELYPVGFRGDVDDIKKNNQLNQAKLRPKVVSHYLLEKMQLAGIDKAYFILRPGKWDIPAYFGDGAMLSMNLGYLIMGLPYGVPFTKKLGLKPRGFSTALIIKLFYPQYCMIKYRNDSKRSQAAKRNQGTIPSN